MMKGLLIKEFLVLTKTYKMQLCIVLLFAVTGAVLNSPAFIMMIPLLLSMLVTSVMNVDESSRWESYVCCLPAGKKMIVSSKYLMVLGAAAVSCAVTSAAFLMLRVRNGAGSESIPIHLSVAMSAALSVTVPSVLLPFYFKFGTSKGRTVYLITAVACALLASLLFAGKDSAAVFGRFKSLADSAALTAVIPASAAAVFGVSLAVSIMVYERREL